MLSKFLRTTYKSHVGQLLTRRISPKVINVRYADMIPASQYDTPFPRKLRLGYTLKTYWEIIPLFVTTCVSLSLMFFSILWACKNKVDVVFSSHSRRNISHTMDLRNPTIHKLLIINQRYPPWPEMAEVLEKMRLAEKRALARLSSCAHP
uniref:Uncharacterized protein n=1 Tax=Heliothis virescens TaxID=7102 RepID=A0A2A4J595_HELVI